MFIFTTRFSKRKALAILLIAAIVIAAVILLFPTKGGGDVVKGIKTEEDRVAYIAGLGYTITDDPSVSKEVTIPESFDEVYENYNALQKECGFDLSGYQGRRVMLYTYCITGYDGYDKVMLDLLVYKDKIIGGSIYTQSVDGFMHGLKAKN